MRIVHLLPAMEQGGVESVVLNLVRLLVDAGHESIVLSRGGRLVETIESTGGRHLALELKSKNPLTFFPRARKLRRTLRELKPDLVCVHSRVPAWLFAFANRALHLPTITYAHGANSVSRYSSVMTRGDAVISPSEFLADYLLTNYPKAKDLKKRLRVVPNCVNLRRFDPDHLDAAFMNEMKNVWRIKDGEFVSMSIGRITKVKGFDAVIRDFAAHGKGRLVIVGGADADKTDVLESLRSLARELAVADRVVFAGAQTKIPECIALADEIVSGNVTKPESFGLSVIEAYAMNRPVRALRAFGGVAEVMRDVARIDRPTLRERVAALYGEDVYLKRTIEIYREVIDLASKFR